MDEAGTATSMKAYTTLLQFRDMDIHQSYIYGSMNSSDEYEETDVNF